MPHALAHAVLSPLRAGRNEKIKEVYEISVFSNCCSFTNYMIQNFQITFDHILSGYTIFPFAAQGYLANASVGSNTTSALAAPIVSY